MKLSFYPKRGTSPQWPGKGTGDISHAGRVIVDGVAVAHDQPVTCESHDGRGQMTREAHVFAFELCKRDGDLHPADKATADFCGVPFVEMEKGDDGEWAPKAAAIDGARGGTKQPKAPLQLSGEAVKV